MSVESTIFSALTVLVGGRVFPDVAPENTVLPYLTYQSVGGDSVNFLAQSVPGRVNCRVQINVWANTRAAVTTLAKQVEDALRVVPSLQTTVLGAPVAVYEPETRMRGSHQDYSFWQ